MATAKIRNLLDRMAEGEMLAARDVLHFSRRPKTVYGALYRLNKAGKIFRLSQGLYMKGNERTPRPSIIEIARAKARAFGKTLTEVSAEFARRMGIEFSPKSEAIFATNGRSCVTRSCHGPMQFVGVSSRKMALQDSSIGVQLRTVWHLGRWTDPALFIQQVVTEWSEGNWNEYDARFKLLPYWLSEKLRLPLSPAGTSHFLLE